MANTKHIKAALENIRKLARTKGAERLTRKAAAKKGPPVAESVGTAEDQEEVLDEHRAAEDDEDEATEGLREDAAPPKDLAKATTLVVLGRGRRGSVGEEPKTEPPKRKPGRPRKGT